MKYKTLIIFGLIVGWVIFGLATPTTYTAVGPENETLSFTVTFTANNYQISNPDEDGYQAITMTGFEKLSIPGEPNLPTKVFPILMPPGAIFKDLEIISQQSEVIPGKYLIKEAPTPQPIASLEGISSDLGYQSVPEVPPKPEIYQSDNPYPQNIIEPGNKGQMRKYTIQEVRFNPIQYQPLSGKLTLIKSITVKINYEPGIKPEDNILSDKVIEKEAEQLLYNFNQFKDEYQPAATTIQKITSTYDYVIITPQALAISTGMTNLVSYRQSQGHSVKVESTEYIDSNYPGVDLSEKIRNYLIANYLVWEIKYVAIVGTHQVIPMRYCGNHYPNDYYYQDLTGTWDPIQPLCGVAVDWYPEVYVGRIPLDNPVQLESYVNRVINYEESTDPYKKRVLLAAGIWYDANDAARSAEDLRGGIFLPNGYQTTRMYEETGDCPCAIPHDYDVSRENIVSHWRDDHYGIAYLAAHGLSQALSSRICELESHNYVDIFSNIDTQHLINDYPTIVSVFACSTAYPEDPDNLGYSFIRQGGVSYMGAVRIAYGSGKINGNYFENLINKQQTNGKSMAEVRLKESFSYPEEALNFNLYGEPLLRVGLYFSLYVDDDNTSGIEDGSPDYPYNSIQEAVDAANPDYNKVIKVASGTYHENVWLNKDGVDLIGEGAGKSIIEGRIEINGGGTGKSFSQTISGFTIRNAGSGYAGIRILNHINPTIKNIIIYGNNYAGISSIDASAIIVNNTIVNNNEYGIILDSSSPVIKNNIIVNNPKYGIYAFNSSPTISYNNLYNNTKGNYSGCSAGIGDISVDPLFKDPANGDYHEKLGSLCVDKGDPVDDYSQEPQPNGSRINMGAYGNTPEATVIDLNIYVDSGYIGFENGSQTYPYNSIQEAIDAMLPVYEYNIHVAEGTYYPKVLINRGGFNLRGAGAGKSIIYGGIEINNWFTQDIISGFTIKDGIVLYSGTPTIKNNIIYGKNKISGIAGVACYNASPTILNNTIVSNNKFGIALFSSQSIVKNNIIINSTDYGIYSDSSSPTISYNNLYNNTKGNYSGCSAGIGDISVDPLFKDPANGDYHEKLGSLCVDKGDPVDDYSQEPQPNGNRINIGAYGNTPEATITYTPPPKPCKWPWQCPQRAQ